MHIDEILGGCRVMKWFKWLVRYIKSGFSECASCKYYKYCDHKPWLKGDNTECNYVKKRGGRQ